MLASRLVSQRINGSVRDLPRNRRGAVAIEYGLLAAMVAIALIGMSTLTNVAEKQSSTFDLISSTLVK